MSERQSRAGIFPRYEIHLTAGGAVAVYRTEEVGQELTPRLGLCSVSQALKAIDRHAKRKIWPYSFDEIGGWAPAIVAKVAPTIPLPVAERGL